MARYCFYIPIYQKYNQRLKESSMVKKREEGLFWRSSSVTWAARHAVCSTSKHCQRKRLWFCLRCVYPQLFNQRTSANRTGYWQRCKGGLDYSASAKWGRMGLILFELHHLSQLYGPISSLKREKAKGGKKGGCGKVMVAGNISVSSWEHQGRAISINIFPLLHQEV